MSSQLIIFFRIFLWPCMLKPVCWHFKFVIIPFLEKLAKEVFEDSAEPNSSSPGDQLSNRKFNLTVENLLKAAELSMISSSLNEDIRQKLPSWRKNLPSLFSGVVTKKRKIVLLIDSLDEISVINSLRDFFHVYFSGGQWTCATSSLFSNFFNTFHSIKFSRDCFEARCLFIKAWCIFQFIVLSQKLSRSHLFSLKRCRFAQFFCFFV